VNQFLDSWLGDETLKFVNKCHREGIKIIPLDNRQKVRIAYFDAQQAHLDSGGNSEEFERDLPGFTTTRDYVMCSNAVAYVTADEKNKLAILVGRNHARGAADPFTVVGDVEITRGSLLFGGGGVRTIFEYEEGQPLGYRLEQALGDEQVALIGFYDSWYLPTKLIDAGIRHSEESDAVRYRAEVDCLQRHIPLTDKRALRYDPGHFQFFDKTLEHAVIILPTRDRCAHF